MKFDKYRQSFARALTPRERRALESLLNTGYSLSSKDSAPVSAVAPLPFPFPPSPSLSLPAATHFVWHLQKAQFWYKYAVPRCLCSISADCRDPPLPSFIILSSSSSPPSLLWQTSITRAFYLLHSSVEVTRPQGIIANIFSQVRSLCFPFSHFSSCRYCSQ